MSWHRGGNGSKATEAIVALILMFLVVPGAFFILMVLGGLSLTVIGGLEILYYVVVIVGLLLKGLRWLEDAFE